MSKADFDIIEWSTETATDVYARLYALHYHEDNGYLPENQETNGLTHVISTPMLIPEAEGYLAKRQVTMLPGEVEAIAIWKPHAFKKHTITVSTIIDGKTLPKTGQLEVIENAIIQKASLADNEKATNIRILSETPKYVSQVFPAGGSRVSYHIIGNGISASDVFNGFTDGYPTRTEAKAELRKILSRSRSTQFNLPVAEEFEIIGINRVATAKSELSKLAVRAKLDIFTIDTTRPHDGWLFYGYPVA